MDGVTEPRAGRPPAFQQGSDEDPHQSRLPTSRTVRTRMCDGDIIMRPHWPFSVFWRLHGRLCPGARYVAALEERLFGASDRAWLARTARESGCEVYRDG